MNRTERLTKAQTIYQQEHTKYETELATYKEEHQNWYTTNKKIIDYNNEQNSYHDRKPCPPEPPEPHIYDADNKTILRIMNELTLSENTSNEYMKLIKFRLKK